MVLIMNNAHLAGDVEKLPIRHLFSLPLRWVFAQSVPMCSITDAFPTTDCRELYMLLGECRYLGESRDAWPERMHRGFVDWLGVGLTVFFEGDRHMACGRPSAKRPRVMACGLGRERLEECMLAYWQAGVYRRDPLLQGWAALNGSFAVTRRQDVVPDRLWYESEAYRHYFARAGVDHVILGRFRFGKGRHMMVNFWRTPQDAPFDKREKDLIARFLAELSTLMKEGSVHGLAGPGRLGLTGRLRQTLDLLLAGKCEKEIAEILGLSLHTVHGYVKGVYERLGVHSRSELFARFGSGLPNGQETSAPCVVELRQQEPC